MCEYIIHSHLNFFGMKHDKDVVDQVDVIFHVSFAVLSWIYFDYEHL